MRVVLDTSAIIYLSDFRKFDEIFTVEEVLREVKDKVSSLRLSSLNLKIEEPNKENLEIVEKIAKGTGDFENLSRTDIKVIALAKEKNCSLISDDRSVQNVAERLGIEYISIFSRKISKLIVWGKYCKNCRKFFEEKVCPVCGSKLIRKPKEAKEIKS